MHVYLNFLCNHYDFSFYIDFVLVQKSETIGKVKFFMKFENLVQFGYIFENMLKSQMHINVYIGQM